VEEVIEREDEANECEFSRNLCIDLEPPIPALGNAERLVMSIYAAVPLEPIRVRTYVLAIVLFDTVPSTPAVFPCIGMHFVEGTGGTVSPCSRALNLGSFDQL
jgi:hypothetical protein